MVWGRRNREDQERGREMPRQSGEQEREGGPRESQRVDKRDVALGG